MTTSLDRLKGAMTRTARGSKWCFWCYAVLALLNGWVYVADGDWSRWVRLIVLVGFTVTTVVYFRSWRILKRAEAQQ